MIWWSLPGPRAFVNAVVDDVREGKSVFLELPSHCPGRLSLSLKQTLGDDFIWLSSTVSASSTPIDFLYGLFVPESDAAHLRNARSLVAQNSFQGYVIWLEGISTANWSSWLEFLAEYERASRAVAPARRSHFLIPVTDTASYFGMPNAIGISRQIWNGWTRPSDIRFYSYVQVEERQNALETELTFALVSELACWDPELCEWLARVPLEQLTQPMNQLTEFAKRRRWSARSADTTHSGWSNGYCQTVGGRPVLHTSIRALLGQRSEIDRLVWRAEIGVLMPYIEEQRQELLKRYQRLLWVPFTTKNNELIEDIFDLEIGHIEYQLSASSDARPEEVNWVSVLKKARNCLSHLEPVTPDLLKFIVEHRDR